MSKHRVISGPHFSAFGLNKERYEVLFRIQPKCRKIRARKNSVFGHFSQNEEQQFLYIRLIPLMIILYNENHWRDNLPIPAPVLPPGFINIGVKGLVSAWRSCLLACLRTWRARVVICLVSLRVWVFGALECLRFYLFNSYLRFTYGFL